MTRTFVSTDQSLIDFAWLHRTLEAEYWGWDYTEEKVKENAANSLCFGLYERETNRCHEVPGVPFIVDDPDLIKQLAFARVITDKVSFSFICDVVVDRDLRGMGHGTKLMECIVAHPDVKKTITVLGTKDAYRFYEKLGFHAPAQPMMQHDPLKP